MLVHYLHLHLHLQMTTDPVTKVRRNHGAPSHRSYRVCSVYSTLGWISCQREHVDAKDLLAKSEQTTLENRCEGLQQLA